MTSYIPVQNIRIFYQRQGDSSRSIVFIHNANYSSETWAQQLSDERFRDYTLITIDQPGHGYSSHSDTPSETYSLIGSGTILQQVISRLNLEQYIMVASSLGNNIVAEAAPLLTGCRGFFMSGASLVGSGIGVSDVLLPFEYGAVLVMDDPSEPMLTGYLNGLIWRQNDAVLHNLREKYWQTDPAFRTNLGSVLSKEEWSDQVGNIGASKRPTAFVFGKEERIVNRAYLERTGLAKWKNETFVIPEAGHLVHIDQPTRFNELLLDFASGVFGSASI